MKKPHLPTSRKWLTGAAAGVVAFAPGGPLSAAPSIQFSIAPLERTARLDRFQSGYEGVLGTSLDLLIEAPRPTDAIACEREILNEIERLRRILSTYDSASEISGWMKGNPSSAPELAELLSLYETWNARTGGLVSPYLGDAIATWRDAARTGRLPDRGELARLTARREALNVDALGKAFIIDRAVAVARRIVPGGLVNLGGDLRAWGDTTWTVGVADPRNPAENAEPLTRFSLRDRAVATSGGYARFHEISGQRFSHLIDPRTRWARESGGSATVVAADCVTANALSTAASIAGRHAGETLAREQGAAGYLFLSEDGGSSSGGALAPSAPPASSAVPAGGDVSAKTAPAPAGPAWPAGYQVTVPVVLKKFVPEARKEIFRPYVVVWIENEQKKVVRTLTVWGNDERWQRKLTMWIYQLNHSDANASPATRATRPAGAYSVTWDGRDDYGVRLPQGNYKISLEVCREAGHHVMGVATLTCGDGPSTGTLSETAESDATEVSYGPKLSS